MEVKEVNRLLKENYVVFEFKAGHTWHFCMKPSELTNKMKKTPLIIGIYRVGDTFPICHARTYLSGCACDLGSKSTNETVPFTFKGPFDLADVGNNFAGRVGVDICITSMGRFVVTHYALGPGHVVTKNGSEAPEQQCCERTLSGELFGGRYEDNLANAGDPAMTLHSTLAGNLMRDIAGISPAAKYLALGRPPPKPPRPLLVDPNVAAKLSTRSIKGQKNEKKKKKGKK